MVPKSILSSIIVKSRVLIYNHIQLYYVLISRFSANCAVSSYHRFMYFAKDIVAVPANFHFQKSNFDWALSSRPISVLTATQ